MTARIPENASTCLVDWSIVTIMGNTMPPRDPIECRRTSARVLRHMRRHSHQAQFIDEILGVIGLVGTERDSLRPIRALREVARVS
jgi:hypothetical protein